MIYSTDVYNGPVKENNDTNKIPAILLNMISYTKCPDEGEIHIPADTLIHIDTLNSIALIGNDHVHIDTHEYTLLLS